tara:strand:+ start:543 stop:836 length:294 start_codon:yes stop_codon:yes gene_type:complete
MSSLSDVWEEYENFLPKVSAKVSNENDDTVSKNTPNEELLKSMNALLLEIHELRREQAKRCSTYMIMIGILFGIMILYVDRLNYNITNKRHMSHPFA